MIFKKTTHTRGDDSKNWYRDKFEYVRQQRDVLAFITILSLLFSAAAVGTVMLLTPYKSVEPFVIQIDEKSGIVKRVDPVSRTEFTSNEAIDRYFIATYIRARESYIPSVFRYNYNLVRVMSLPKVFEDYERSISRANPESPANLLKAGGKRSIKFKSINFVKRDPRQASEANRSALVRILLTDIGGRMSARRDYHSVVTIDFKYSNLYLSEEERFLNPIGFLVTGYEITREVIE